MRSSPQLGGIVKAASRKIRRRWMKRHRANTVAVSLQRGDACRSTAIRVQQPQLGGIVRAASRKIRRRWVIRSLFDPSGHAQWVSVSFTSTSTHEHTNA